MSVHARNTIIWLWIDRFLAIVLQASLANIHAQNLVLGHLGANLRGHRAEIFANEHAFVAMRLEGKNRKKLVAVVKNVRSGLGAKPCGHPVKAVKTHHMIESQHAAIVHLIFKAGPEVSVAALPNVLRMKR